MVQGVDMAERRGRVESPSKRDGGSAMKKFLKYMFYGLFVLPIVLSVALTVAYLILLFPFWAIMEGDYRVIVLLVVSAMIGGGFYFYNRRKKKIARNA